MFNSKSLIVQNMNTQKESPDIDTVTAGTT